MSLLEDSIIIEWFWMHGANRLCMCVKVVYKSRVSLLYEKYAVRLASFLSNK